MRNRGFTLLECVLTLAIILIGFLAIARVNPMSYRGATVSKDRLTALRIARNVIERVRSRPFSANCSDLVGPVPEQGETVEGNQLNETFAVDSVTPNTAATHYGTVAVTVSWVEGTAVGSAGIKKTLTLSGGLSREP